MSRPVLPNRILANIIHGKKIQFIHEAKKWPDYIWLIVFSLKNKTCEKDTVYSQSDKISQKCWSYRILVSRMQGRNIQFIPNAKKWSDHILFNLILVNTMHGEKHPFIRKVTKWPDHICLIVFSLT